MAKIYPGMYGVPIDIYTGYDLTLATTVEFLVKKPDNSTATWTAAVQGTASDGVIRYTLQSGDLNLVGVYKIQARIVTAVKDLKGDTFTISVSRDYS